MVEPPRHDLDRAVEKSMDLFSRARVGTVAAIKPLRPKKILLALDGSSQDAFGIRLASQFRSRFGCGIAVIDAREGEVNEHLATDVAASMDAEQLPNGSDESFVQILNAVDKSQCDLLITPCPYGRDLDAVGPDSAGTVIDVLLARCPVPLLVVRNPFEMESDLFHQVVMILTAENEAAYEASKWATGMIAPKGKFHLMLVLEREMFENIAALMQSIAPEADISVDSLSHALARTYMRLHRGLQKTAGEEGFHYKLKLSVEGDAGPIAKEDARRPTLRVLALERSDHVSQGSVQARIRQSMHPILVVCTQHENEPS